MIFKCKMCGGDLEITEGVSIAECEYCGTEQTLPNVMDENLQNIFNRANTLRLKSEFDKAEKLYEKIIQSDFTQAEAYWGLILCKYGIEYVDDPATFKKVPTCHRTSYDSIIADDDYKSALQYADAHQRTIYEEQAKEIDRIQKEILALAQKEETYDVFICYKETDATGARTQDSVIANDIYYQLTNEGFKVFYAAITLEGKLGSAYEPIIFAALNSAKVMLAIGTKPEYFNAVWVKNEWSRYLKIIKKDRTKLLIPCYRDMDAYELPEEFAHLQAQDMGKIGFINDVVRGIKKVVANTEPKATIVKETVVTGGNINISPLLERAFMFLEDGDWNGADEYCEKVLDLDPKNAIAYLGKLMAELKVKTKEELINQAEPFNALNNFQKAVRFGDDALKSELNGYVTEINIRKEQKRKDAILNEAKSSIKGEIISNYEYALNLLESISGWKNANELIANCKIKIEEIKAREEAERLERERQAEIARKEAEKRAKRNKKIAAIVTPIVAAIIVFVIVLNTIIIPNGKYNDAIALMDEGKYEEAYKIFNELGDYKDANDKASNIRFLKNKEQFNKNIKAGDYVLFGAYEQDDIKSNGKENIEWLVLEVKESKVLVISTCALDCKDYNTSCTDVTWETCTLRKWLNSDFINSAFSTEEKAVIPTVTVSADKNPYYSTDPGNSTQDQVFLLSVTEINEYFSSSHSRRCKPTEYAVSNGASVNRGDTECGWWWLRSPGSNQNEATYINSYGGGIDNNSTEVNGFDGCSVRPAMWIDLNA